MITSAGSDVLGLHRRGDAEQALHARLAEHAGVAVGRAFGALGPADVADSLARPRRGDVATHDLAAALPRVSEVVVATVADLLV